MVEAGKENVVAADSASGKSVGEYPALSVKKKAPGWLAALPHVLIGVTSNLSFGYHIGVVNIPLPSIAADLGISHSPLLKGVIVSAMLVGAFLGGIAGGWLSDRVGRRRNLQLDSIPLIIGTCLSASAQTLEVMVLGRFLAGLGVGASSGYIVIYISEIAPAKYRGGLGCLAQIGTCLGNVAALLVGIPAETDPHWWRVMFWLAVIPGLILLVGMEFAVESPRWLSQEGRWDEAEKTLNRLMIKEEVAEALQELRSVKAQVHREASWRELLEKKYFKVVILGGILFLLQQCCGMNAVLYYSTSLLEQAGVSNGAIVSAIVGTANLIGGFVLIPLMERLGRRELLMISYTGMAGSMGLMVLGMVLPAHESVLHALSIVGTLGFVFGFALGAGPITGIVLSEVASTYIRAKAMAVGLAVHWVSNFTIGLLFLLAVEEFGLAAIYAILAAVSVLSILYVSAYVPATRGKTLEELEQEL